MLMKQPCNRNYGQCTPTLHCFACCLVAMISDQGCIEFLRVWDQ